MGEEEQGTSPEAVERWVSTLAAIPSPVLTDDEWTAWSARRKEDREWEFSQAKKRERIFLFEVSE